MAQRIQIHGGTWWRFPQYQIENGCIRPKLGLQVQAYDPWEAYEVAGTKKEGNERIKSLPYFSLISLLRHLPDPDIQPVVNEDGTLRAVSQRLALTPEQESIILDWCNHYGLLGLLSHQAQAAVMHPRWEPGGQVTQLFDSAVLGSQPPVLRPTLRRYVREGGRWVCQRLIYAEGPQHGLLLDSDGFRGALVSPDERPSDWPTSGVYISETLIGNEWTFQKFRQCWAGFFPDVRAEEVETYLYPLPLTDDFWHSYAEPVIFFVEAARIFCDAIEALVKCKNEPIVKVQGSAVIALERLNALACHSTISLTHSQSSFIERWKAPSLLSAFALMAIHDLAGGQFIGRCASCGVFFRSDKHYHAKHCSRECKKRSERRQNLASTKDIVKCPRPTTSIQEDEQVRKVRDILS